MHKILIPILLLFCLGAMAQTKYSKVKIDLINKDIRVLAKAGLEVDHGYIAPGKCLINDFSAKELEKIKSLGFEYEIIIDDVQAFYRSRSSLAASPESGEQALCDLNEPDQYITPKNYSGGSMGGFLTWDELLLELDSMSLLYPQLITPKTPIGINSLEDRPIYWLRISDNPQVNEEEPEVLYTALHHAREPNSLAQMIFFMWYLLENYDKDPEIKQLVDHTELYFIPCINPDGYVFNQQIEPNGGGLWRKNKRMIGPQLFGVDLNRNYDFKWGLNDEGSSPHPGDQTYRGESAFSEPETQAVKEFCEQHEFGVILNYHTFGNLLIHPWGFEDTPTEDDDVFKKIGYEMTKENNFLLGTGIETVGYRVNGDSDDWMYGEQTSKNKSFSYTPEVGSSLDYFWPHPNRIDFLNKSCMYQNLTAARVLNPWLGVDEIEKSEFVFDRDGNITWRLTNLSLQAREYTVKIKSASGNILFLVNERSYNLDPMEEVELTVPYYIQEEIPSGAAIQFIVEVSSEGFEFTHTFDKLLALGERVELVNDRINDLENFTVTSNWGISDQIYRSLPGSLADSPDGNYSPNAHSVITLAEPIDLSDAIQAHLSFDALWEIEKDYDYAQVLASSDNNNFEPLCGFYTNTGTENQAKDEPVYDGISQAWVKENINLEKFLGEKEVWLQFLFKSDQAVQLKGIYIDNIKVEKITGRVVSTKELNNNTISIQPNPTEDSFILNINQNDDFVARSVQLFNALGKLVLERTVANGQNTIAVDHLQAGIYKLRIVDLTGRSVTKSLLLK